MNWILTVISLCLFPKIAILQQIQSIQIINIDPEIHVLNLHFDHCRRPKSFSWSTHKCECPLPLKEENETCVCDNCLYHDTKYGHSEGRSENLPRFISEIFEEIHEEMENIKENEKNGTANGDTKNESIFNDNVKRENDDSPLEISNLTNNQRSYQQNVTHSTPNAVIENTSEDINSTSREIEVRMLNSTERNINFNIFPVSKCSEPRKTHRSKVTCKRRKNKSTMQTLGMLNRRTMDDNIPTTIKKIPFRPNRPKAGKPPRKVNLRKFKYFTLSGGHKPQSYSGSVVGGLKSGKIATGEDNAKGMISNFRGTGAISLGTGGGSAGGAAFTGTGKSNISVTSKGTSASGFSFIGKNGTGGMSTLSLLLGTGDAIAVNSLAGKGSASAVGITTKNTAGAATSAFGPASASVSAAVGKGGTQSASSFTNNLHTSAGVERQDGALVESSAVGNPDQDITAVTGDDPDFVNIPEKFQPYSYDFDFFFSVNR